MFPAKWRSRKGDENINKQMAATRSSPQTHTTTDGTKNLFNVTKRKPVLMVHHENLFSMSHNENLFQCHTMRTFFNVTQ